LPEYISDRQKKQASEQEALVVLYEHARFEHPLSDGLKQRHDGHYVAMVRALPGQQPAVMAIGDKNTG
jgi:hypothetical protein